MHVLTHGKALPVDLYLIGVELEGGRFPADGCGHLLGTITALSWLVKQNSRQEIQV